MTRKINCQVQNEYVKGAGVVAGVAGSHDDVLLHLVFDDFWTDLAKKITWVDAYGESSVITILTQTMISDDGYDVPIPYGAKKYPGKMKMTIKGSTAGSHTISATVNKTTWESSALGGTNGTFKFTHNGTNWIYSSSTATLSTYGITVTGTPVEGDVISVTRAVISNVVSVTIVSLPYNTESRASLSASCEFTILESAWDDDASADAEITMSQAAQLQAEIDELEDDIQEIIDNVDDSEAWAVGQIDGVDVPSTDTRYHNNSKYYSGQAALSAASAEVSEENASASEAAAESAKDTAVSAKDTAVSAKNEAVSAEAKIENMTASATGLTPGSSPTVTKTETATGFNLAFGIPEGEKGETGDAAGFGSVSATIDNNQGIPSVTVTESGPDTAKVFHFDFRNLKGPKGDAGAGSGDMLMSDYDSQAAVKNAGGIVAYLTALYQTIANKVTSFQTTPDDTHYPSEKLVKDSLDTKQDTLTFDSTPTSGSTNPVTSDGVYSALSGKVDIDSSSTESFTVGYDSGGLYIVTD